MKKALVLSAAFAVATSGIAAATPFVHPQAWTESKPSEVKMGGTYRSSRFGEENTLNPFYNRISPSITNSLYAPTLFTREPVNRKWIPQLAESYTLSADKKTYTINLRPELKWSDGKKITADDFILAYKINTDPKFETEYADLYVSGDKPIVVAKVDTDTIRVTFPAATATAFNDMANLQYVPTHIWGPLYEKGVAAVKAAFPLSADPATVVGSGPYKLTGYRAGERFTMTRNPYYGEWNKDSAGRPLPYIENIVTTLYKDQNAEFAAFLAGQTDYFEPRSGDDLAQLTRAKQAGNLKVEISANIGPNANNDMISFNWNKKSDPWKQNLFRNVDFRRAMSHITNRAAMVQIATGGFGTPLYSLVYPVLTQFQSPTMKKYEFNPEAATALLKKIGFTKKNSAGYLVDSTGRQLEFDLSPNAGNTRRAAEAQIFADEAKKIGVKVNVRPVDVGTWSDLLSSEGDDRKFDAILWGQIGGDQDLPYSEWSVGCKGGGTAYNKSGKCIFPWETQEQALLLRAKRELDDDKRKQIIFQMQDIETENQPHVFLVARNYHVAWASRIQGQYPKPLWNSLFGSADSDLLWINE